MTNDTQQLDEVRSILHVCRREILRPIRDQILRVSGYNVESTCVDSEAIEMFREHPFALVLVDVEGADGVEHAEKLCADVRTIHPGQLVAFVCNWRVAFLSDCPDEVLRTEFDPEGFVAGVKKLMDSAG
jgi:DNA-binding response OmpR family regulator